MTGLLSHIIMKSNEEQKGAAEGEHIHIYLKKKAQHHSMVSTRVSTSTLCNVNSTMVCQNNLVR